MCQCTALYMYSISVFGLHKVTNRGQYWTFKCACACVCLYIHTHTSMQFFYVPLNLGGQSVSMRLIDSTMLYMPTHYHPVLCYQRHKRRQKGVRHGYRHCAILCNHSVLSVYLCVYGNSIPVVITFISILYRWCVFTSEKVNVGMCVWMYSVQCSTV